MTAYQREVAELGEFGADPNDTAPAARTAKPEPKEPAPEIEPKAPPGYEPSGPPPARET